MSIRRYIYAAMFLLSVIIPTGCTLEAKPEVLEGTGTVHITVSAPVETKSPLTADQDKMIKTLSVWLVNGTSGIVKDTSFTTPNAMSSVVTFNGVERGDHKLYIVANYTGLDSSYLVGETINDDFLNTTLGPILDADCPSFTADDGIPSSIAMDISVAPGTNRISAELLRAVGRMSITFKNAAQGYDLYIGDIFLAERNISKGYLFQKEDHSKPGDAVVLNFPALGEMKKLPEGSMGKLYDHYLFETSHDIADPFTLSFVAGLYPAGTPESSVMYTSTTTQVDVLESVGATINTHSNVNNLYLIKHSSTSVNRYMCVEDGILVLKEVSSDAELLAMENDEFRKYLWRLSDIGETARIIHDQTGKEITYEANNAASLIDSGSGRTLTISQNNTAINFSYNTSGWRPTTYYLASNPSYTGMLGNESTSGNYRNWNLRKVTIGKKSIESMGFAGAEKNVSTDRVHTIRYIDKYGSPVPLQYICRNEYVDIIVNVKYHSETGHFDFAVESWGTTPVENETTFD